ncbi:MAG: hypothetical protein HS103_17820 [Anaerolineales bacterium]|nr:hypothetical protein [Anaerolineales bacterium]
MVDLHGFMTKLATIRPLFHSEADFQHAFAWHFHELFPTAIVRLEYPVFIDRWIYLDLWLHTFDMRLAVELKYKTLKLEIAHDNERFQLKNQGAQDLGRYDFLKDVARLEQVSGTNADVQGYAVLLTNDPSYWGTGRAGTVDTNFRLHHGRSVTGEMTWLPHASDGTMRNRIEAIQLRRDYTVEWNPYSKISPNRGGEFRYLVFKV